MRKLTIIDSHTGGEPTRVVLSGGPELGGGSLALRRERFQREFDRFRPAEFARFLEFARGSLGEVQDCLIDGHERKYIDGVRFDKMWLLSKRAVGANTRLQLYLKDCVAKGLEPWRHPKNPKSENAEPETGTPNPDPASGNPEPGTRNS